MVLKMLNRVVWVGDETWEVVCVIVSDVGVIVMFIYDGLMMEEERYFDFIFIVVKMYVFEVVK